MIRRKPFGRDVMPKVKPPIEKITIAVPAPPHASPLTVHAVPEETVQSVRNAAAGGIHG